MAFEHILLTLPGAIANANLSNYQFRWVKLSNTTANYIMAIASMGDTAIGVLQDTPASSGRAALVALNGISKVEAGTSVGWVAGCAVGWTSVGVTGGAIPQFTSVAGGKFAAGRYIKNESSVALGQYISVHLAGGPFDAATN
jgi:hypothetical protein